MDTKHRSRMSRQRRTRALLVYKDMKKRLHIKISFYTTRIWHFYKQNHKQFDCLTVWIPRIIISVTKEKKKCVCNFLSSCWGRLNARIITSERGTSYSSSWPRMCRMWALSDELCLARIQTFLFFKRYSKQKHASQVNIQSAPECTAPQGAWFKCREHGTPLCVYDQWSVFFF